jgi:hypothetical protein
MEYHKIETMFERGEDFNVIESKLRNPVYATLKSWRASEKLDGTNIRVYLLKDGTTKIRGRSDNADIKGDLIDWIQKNMPIEKMKEIMWRPNKEGVVEPVDVCFYGEGLGAGIQKGGGNYLKNKEFVLFDILVDSKWWLDYDTIIEIAGKLGIKYAPDLGVMTLEEIIEKVKKGFNSVFAKENTGIDCESEGIVARPIETLFDKRMNRVIIKIKSVDFRH